MYGNVAFHKEKVFFAVYSLVILFPFLFNLAHLYENICVFLLKDNKYPQSSQV